MVVCSRTGGLVVPPFLPPHTIAKEQLHQLEELFVVTTGKEVLVFREKPCIDESQDPRNIRKKGGRDSWELESYMLSTDQIWRTLGTVEQL